MLPRCSRRPHRDRNIIPEAAIRVLDASAISAGMGVALISSSAAPLGLCKRCGSSAAGTTKPGGTGSPAVVSSPTLAPFPPSARHLEDQSLRTSESRPSRHPLLTMCLMVTMSISTARASRVKVSLGMDCTTDLAVSARLSKRAKQRCVRDYRPCHCSYFLITL